MIDPKLVTEKIQILDVLKYLGVSEYKTRKDELVVRCLNPLHPDKKPSLTINNGRYKGFFRCWSCEFQGGDIFALVSLVKRVTYKESLDIVARIAGVKEFSSEEEFLENAIKNTKSLKIISKKKEITELTEVDLPRGCISAVDHNAAEVYNLSNELVERFDVFFCNKGYYQNRLIFPVRFSNKLVTFLARWNGECPKDIDPKLYTPDAPIGQILYNYDEAKSDEVILVEGIKDCMRVSEAGYDCVSSFSNNVTEDQAALLTKFKRVTILPDRNAKEEKLKDPEIDPGMRLVKTAVSFLAHKVDIFVGFVKDGKDPGDSTVSEIHEAVRNSTKYKFTKEEKQEQKIIINRVIKPMKKS